MRFTERREKEQWVPPGYQLAAQLCKSLPHFLTHADGTSQVAHFPGEEAFRDTIASISSIRLQELVAFYLHNSNLGWTSILAINCQNHIKIAECLVVNCHATIIDLYLAASNHSSPFEGHYFFSARTILEDSGAVL